MVWFTVAAFGGEPTVGALIRPEVALDLANDFADEDTFEVNTFGRAFARGELKNGDRWFFEGRFQHHLLNGADLEGWWDLDVGETGIDAKVAGPVRLRAGALIERWGRLDLLPIADVLNPRDGRTGLLTPAEFQRIPIPMAVVRVGTDHVSADTVLIPFATADRMWLRESDWAYVRQGWADEYLGQVDRWEGDSESKSLLSNLIPNSRLGIRDQSPAMRRGLDAAVNGNNLPEALFGNGEIAERLTVHGGNADLGVEVGYLRSRQPQSALDPALVTLIQTEVVPPQTGADFTLTDVQAAITNGPLDVEWPRTVVAGLDGAVLAGPIQIRAESMFQSARVVRQSYTRSTTVPQLGAGIGLDYAHGSSLVVTLETRWQHLFDPPDELLFSLPDQIQIAGGMRLSVVHEKLTIQLGGAYDPTFSEYLGKPSVGWRFGDGVSAEVGAVLLGGDTPPAADLRSAFVYTGGPLSYWTSNDCVTFALTLIK
ncbi:MAG: hypothetical protein ABMB14_38050 [Myxococcota bacterium]